MSGLLVKSHADHARQPRGAERPRPADIPVLLGGAALTRTYVERDLREVYEGRLFYGKDAFEGLHVMDRLGDAQARRRGRRPRLGPRAVRVAGAGPRRRRRERAPVDRGDRCPARSPEVEDRQRGVRAAVPRVDGRQGHPARRHRRLPQRDRAVPQPVAVPARGAARTTTRSRPASARRCATQLAEAKADDLLRARRSSTATSPRQRRRQRPRHLGATSPATAELARFRFPRQTQGAVPVHRRLLPPDRRRARSTTSPSTS